MSVLQKGQQTKGMVDPGVLGRGHNDMSVGGIKWRIR